MENLGKSDGIMEIQSPTSEKYTDNYQKSLEISGKRAISTAVELQKMCLPF